MKKKSSIWADLYQSKQSRTIKKQCYLAQFISPQHGIFLELFVSTGQNIKTLKSKNSRATCFGIDYDFELCKTA